MKAKKKKESEDSFSLGSGGYAFRAAMTGPALFEQWCRGELHTFWRFRHVFWDQIECLQLALEGAFGCLGYGACLWLPCGFLR